MDSSVSKYKFNLIISGLRIPAIDGVELMKEIKRKRIDTPVIFITAYGEVESYMDLMNMGAFEYMNKPVREKDILRVIGGALNAYSGVSSVSSSQPF